MSRMEQLQEMLKSEPDDEFLNYALALELDKADQHNDALRLFQKLTEHQPPYVPAFFMAGQMLSRIDRNDEAEKFLTDGIAQAKDQGNGHAAGEMSELLAMIRDN